MRTLLMVVVLLIPFALYAGESDRDLFDGRELKFNPYESTWTYERSGTELKYNPYNTDWKYQEKNWQPRFNPYTGAWE